MIKVLWMLAPVAAVATWRRSSGEGLFARVLRIGGVATLLVGASFVQGAVEEDEPAAAFAGARTFATAGALMIAASWVFGRGR